MLDFVNNQWIRKMGESLDKNSLKLVWKVFIKNAKNILWQRVTCISIVYTFTAAVSYDRKFTVKINLQFLDLLIKLKLKQ